MDDSMENTTEAQEDIAPETISEAEKQLQTLKDRARTLGLTFSNNIGIDALRKKINDKLDGKDEKPETPASSLGSTQASHEVPAPRVKTRAEIDQDIRTTQSREQLALVRCRIYNLDPNKRDLHGEIITVANRYVGTVRRFIPFGEATESGYHIEKILYEDLKQRRFQMIKTHNEGGKIRIETRDVPEYQIEILPQLTAAELQELALTQQAAIRVGV